MSLQDAIEDLKAQIEEKKKEEDAALEAQEEEVTEEVKEEESPKEEKVEEKVEEKPEPKPEVKEELDNSGYARLRREAAAAEKKAARLEEELKVEREAKKEQAIDIEEPKQEIAPELQEIVRDHTFKRAEREFQNLEDKFKSSTPDYGAVASEYANALAQSIRIQNPRMGLNEIAEKTKESILLKAAGWMKGGFNPIEELYHEAKDLGFTGEAIKNEAKFRKQAEKELETAVTPEEEIRPDMKKVKANMARSTGMGASTGKSEGQLTKKAAAELSGEEWMKLPIAERNRLMSL